MFPAVALFAVAYVMLSLRYRQAFLILSTVWMIIVDVMGIMYLWDIKFNAISLVNLVVVSIHIDSSLPAPFVPPLIFQVLVAC